MKANIFKAKGRQKSKMLETDNDTGDHPHSKTGGIRSDKGNMRSCIDQSKH